MPPTRSQRSGESLEAVQASIREEFGPAARIVAAEKVTTTGIGGMFKKHHYEVTVEVPSPGDEPVAHVSIATGAPVRAGILALLADAEDEEDRFAARAAGRHAALAGVNPMGYQPMAFDAVAVHPIGVEDVVSADEGSADFDGIELDHADAFAAVMDDLAFNGVAPVSPLSAPAPLTPAEERAAFDAIAGAAGVSGASAVDAGRLGGPDHLPGIGSPAPAVATATATVTVPAVAAPALPGVPAVRRAEGDLVLVVGRDGDVLVAAAAVERTAGVRGADVTDRRSAILARAAGVQESHGTVGALTWDASVAETLRAIAPDQVWAAVDVGRKHDDTVRWVHALAAVVPIAGIIALGTDETSTPETAHMLGLPVVDVRDWR